MVQLLIGFSSGYLVFLYPLLIGGMLIGFRLIWGTLVIFYEAMNSVDLVKEKPTSKVKSNVVPKPKVESKTKVAPKPKLEVESKTKVAPKPEVVIKPELEAKNETKTVAKKSETDLGPSRRFDTVGMNAGQTEFMGSGSDLAKK